MAAQNIETEAQSQWINDQLHQMCKDLLKRHPLRRGPLVMTDDYLKEIIKGIVAHKAKTSR